jgi:hypothetical protein
LGRKGSQEPLWKDQSDLKGQWERLGQLGPLDQQDHEELMVWPVGMVKTGSQDKQEKMVTMVCQARTVKQVTMAHQVATDMMERKALPEKTEHLVEMVRTEYLGRKDLKVPRAITPSV